MIQAGVRFTLYGWALVGDRLRGIADRPNPNEPWHTAKGRGKHPSAYDVLACLGSDASCPDDPDEVVREFGEMLPSRAIAIADHARKIREFFTEAELAALSEIQ